LDLIASALVPLLAVWVYEVSNLVVLVAQGASVSISMTGWIPLGVAGVSQNGLSPLTKVFQIALATGLLVPIWALFSKARLLVAETFLLATLGVYLASAYWEMLSLLTVIPMAAHESLFVVGTGVITIVLLMELAYPLDLGPQPQPLRSYR
jgi:hypothetical protein